MIAEHQALREQLEALEAKNPNPKPKSESCESIKTNTPENSAEKEK